MSESPTDSSPEVYINISVSSLTYAGMVEIQHGLHVSIKNVMQLFHNHEIDGVAAKARLQDIADLNKKLLESYIDKTNEERRKDPF